MVSSPRMLTMVLCTAILAATPVATRLATRTTSPVVADSVAPVRQTAEVAVVRATFPGRNGRIVFLETVQPGQVEGGRRDIFTIRQDGTGLKRLTFRGDHGTAQWGPFGHRILYNVSTPRGSDIWVMGARGRHKHRVLAGAHSDYAAAWAPSGRRFLFLRSALPFDRLFVYSFRTRSATPIRTPDGSFVEILGAAAWSPDGRRIVFAHCDCDDDNSLTSDLFTIRPNGTGLRRLTSIPHSDEGAPDWSPTGDRLVYNQRGEFSNCSRLYTISADGSAPASVRAGCNTFQAQWSPSGTKFVAYRYEPRVGLWIMNVNGSSRRFLVSGGSPDWQSRH